MYDHLTYLKVISVLKQLKKQIRDFDLISIKVSTLEYESLNCFNTLSDLHERGEFLEPESFSLVHGQVYLHGIHAFYFKMGNYSCKISESGDLNEEQKEILKEVLPLDEPEDTSWETVLSHFIKKVKIIYEKKLDINI